MDKIRINLVVLVICFVEGGDIDVVAGCISIHDTDQVFQSRAVLEVGSYLEKSVFYFVREGVRGGVESVRGGVVRGKWVRT